MFRSQLLLLSLFHLAPLSAIAQSFAPSIHYNTYRSGGLNSGGGIVQVDTTSSGSPAVRQIRITIQDGDDLLGNFTRERTTIAMPSPYDSAELVAMNANGDVLIQLTDTDTFFEETITAGGQTFTTKEIYVEAAAIFKDGALTIIPAGTTSVFYDINDDGVAVGARYRTPGGNIRSGYWVPVYYKDGILHEIPHPSGTSYGFTSEGRFIRKDDSAFATAITNAGLILCTGTETPDSIYQDQGAFGAIICGAGDDSIIFTHQIGSESSTKIDAFFDSAAQSNYHTATDINATGEIVGSQTSWSGLNQPDFGSTNTQDAILLYLPSANYGLSAGLNFIGFTASSASEDMRDHGWFQISDTGLITATAESFRDITYVWFGGSFVNLTSAASTPGFVVQSIVDANESGQILVIAESTEDGPQDGRDYSLVLNGRNGIIVNVTTDGEDADPTDDNPDSDANTPGIQISLRSAIQALNARKSDTILFAIPGSGVPEIQLTKALPVVELRATIDGTSQSAGRVIVKGNNLNAAGLNLQAGNAVVKGLGFYGFVGEFGTGIRISSNSGNIIQNCYFGVDATGNLPEPLSRGILIDNSNLNQIGGGAEGEGNLIWATNFGVLIQGAASDNNKIIGNTIGLGVNGDGLINSDNAGDLIEGTAIKLTGGDNNEIGGAGALGNTLAGDISVFIEATVPITGTRIEGNRIGLNGDGDTVVGAAMGLFIGGLGNNTLTNTVIRNNKLAGHNLADIWGLGNGVIGTEISNNEIGFKFDGSGETVLQPGNVPTAYGIRLDQGTYTIDDNTIGGQLWNILVAGQVMAEYTPPQDTNNDGLPDTEGNLEFLDPDGDNSPDIETTNGKGTVIENNTIGVFSDNTVPPGVEQRAGVVLYGAALEAKVEDNTIAGHALASIYVKNGKDHTISGNTVGTADGTDQGTSIGIFVQDAIESTIGANNVIGRCSVAGIVLRGDSVGTRILNNKIGTTSNGLTSRPNNIGLLVSELGEAPDDEVIRSMQINSNLISGNTHAGVQLDATPDGELVLTNNRIGVAENGGPMANGLGLRLSDGDIKVQSGIVAHSRTAGIAVSGTGNDIELEGVSIFNNGENKTGAEGILFENAPHTPPRQVGVARSLPDASGKVQMVFALPILGATPGTTGSPALPGEPVTIEIFGNPNPSDLQGRTPLFQRTIDPTKTWSETFTVESNSTMATQANFTATVTRRGATSSFSTKKEPTTFTVPEISFGISQNGNVVITWPTSGIDGLYDLEETRSFEDGTSWNRDISNITNNGTTSTAEFPPSDADEQFFRLTPDPDALLN